MPTLDTIRIALGNVIDPEVGLDIINLGLVYDIALDARDAVNVRMTMTSRGCPMRGIIEASTRGVLESVPGIGAVDVEVVWEPPWTPEKITPEGRKLLGL
ncbi:MAG TPA: metal-sulfur cluster assembly factor [Oscillatoriaceae cyanobacterium]